MIQLLDINVEFIQMQTSTSATCLSAHYKAVSLKSYRCLMCRCTEVNKPRVRVMRLHQDLKYCPRNGRSTWCHPPFESANCYCIESHSRSSLGADSWKLVNSDIYSFKRVNSMCRSRTARYMRIPEVAL